MAVTFESKPIPISYKTWTIYKLYQLLAIIKIWGNIKLNEAYFLIYILDTEISLNELIEKTPVLFSEYFANKIIDFALKNEFVYFNRKKILLSNTGKYFLEESMKLNVFEELLEQIKNLKKEKKKIKEYLKNRENINVKN